MARPRGYASWNPRDETRALIFQVQEVLVEYKAHLPLTLRQIFYRLVGQYDYDKTEKAYARLCESCNRARRAGMIPFASIRDDGTQESRPLMYEGISDFWDETRDNAGHYRRNRMADQDIHIELWCEAAGMVPQLFQVAAPYSVPVYSTGGFSSITVTWEIAQRCAGRDKPTVFLHVGDFDPSGESIFTAMTEDTRKFLLQQRLNGNEDEEFQLAVNEAWAQSKPLDWDGADLHPVRVALTEDQVTAFDLPTAPPKSTDTRSRNWVGQTCQLEAMAPDDLATIIRDEIKGRIDLERFNALRDLEDPEREEIYNNIPD